MIEITDIEAAIKKLQDLLKQVEPYRSYVTVEYDNLSEAISLLKSPTNAIVGTIVEKLRTVHQSFKAYESMAPTQVSPILDMLNNIIASLSS